MTAKTECEMRTIAIVGATGLVGSCFLDLMQERNFPFKNLKLFAGQKNKGKTIAFNGRKFQTEELNPSAFKGVSIAFFSAGGSVSRMWAKRAVDEGCFVIDNSSAFRMEKNIPLIVPEINADILSAESLLIANPNCSTIQMTLALHPLDQTFGLESVQTATYQSMSGAGSASVRLLKEESLSVLKNSRHFGQTAFNCTPKIGEIADSGFSLEDIKMQEETKKILSRPGLSVSAFCVRVPTFESHGEVVWVKLKNRPKDRSHFIKALQQQKGLAVMEDPKAFADNKASAGKDPAFVGRIHQSKDDPLTWMMWISCDNLRKGAALNGIQIAEHLIQSKIIPSAEK